ncbi:LOW QUALITY PROTEIN: hypothetical protein V1478_000189 [Vespula squamosa]|uniref:Uncharacterized protein n=1 Tax=Vespula squamosa TaxID=30214 RepID=A0ABD2C8P0_VESSQ
MIAADKLEYSENNRNYDGIVEEPENQIFCHRTLPNLLKKNKNYLCENSEKLAKVPDFSYYILQLLSEEEREAICEACDVPKELRYFNV